METILAEQMTSILTTNGREIFLINNIFLLSAPLDNQFLNGVQTEMREINEQERNIIRLMPQSLLPDTIAVTNESNLKLQLFSRYQAEELPTGSYIVEI